MEKNLRIELENYIEEWHYDMMTYKRALNIGRYLFAFMNYLDDEKLGKKARRKYEENTHLIGYFETQYGNNNDFKNAKGANINIYEEEFKMEIAYTKADYQFYKTTWNKLEKYVSNEKNKKYIDELEEEYEDLGFANDVIDFVQLINYINIEEASKMETLKATSVKIQDNYVEYEECKTKEEYNQSILKSWEALKLVCSLIESSEVTEELKKEVSEQSKEIMSGFHELTNN